ncbi:MAG: glycerol kinase GlpK [Verrucomicrobiae bacterium]|nr:glycerol kinase GlpK [Verrucomicrobiae bacterium]
MSQRHVLALDQGTTSSRAIIFDALGQIVASAQQEFRQIFPKPGWVEHDPIEIWESQLETAREALEKAGLSAGDIAGIGITNQRETTLIWNRTTGKPVMNAIVWQDRRTADFCDALRAGPDAAHIQQTTGLVIDAYFSGSKIRWMLENVPGVREQADAGELAFGTVDSWLVWNLTGGRSHLTDVSNASRTLLLNLETLAWDDDMLHLLGVPAALLPEVRSNSEVLAETDASLFGAPIPIAGMAGDQHAALFGQACHSPGMAKNTYGTGCFMLMNTGSEPIRSKNRLLSTVAWQMDGQTEYALEGSVFVGGAIVQWLRDQLGIIEKSSDIEALAQTVDDNGGVYFVPAFAGLGAPYWDQHARGTISGLTRGSSKGHLARAALEAIAFQSWDLLQAMTADSGIDLAELRVDGGASLNPLLMQFQADLLGVPVVRPMVAETTALGAAYLAGLATGVWNDRSEIADNWKVDARFEPATSSDEMATLLAGWKQAIERTRTNLD